ncbi:hypothetical protein CRG98_019480 [Punica granatum]|uniref:FAF domain-containing protein n=1 Tax=Punica granatum TaxID=22663 RepID=A0A2I0JXE4_PUNGR|nr:hypothetical protein CRG98_019480 [Punica granatum]
MACPGQQGILSILDSDCKTIKNNSLRKTLSADMLSKKWLPENKLSVFDSYSQGNRQDQEDEERRVLEDQSRVDSSWSSMLTQKAENEEPTKSSLPPPYVHPLVKKSASSLSSKSLEGASLHMSSRRDCGRLVLKAVSVSSPNNFQAQREEGRLVLGFSGCPISDLGSKIEEEEIGEESDEMVEELDEGFWNSVQNNKEKDEETEDDDQVEEQQQIETETPRGSINVGQMLLRTNKPITVPQSLPLLPRAAEMASPPPAPAEAAAASFSGHQMLRQHPRIRNCSTREEEDEPLSEGKKRMCLELAPLSRGCSEQRRSVLFCRPRGILTA